MPKVSKVKEEGKKEKHGRKKSDKAEEKKEKELK